MKRSDVATLWTVGYGAWAAPVRAERLLEALKERGVTRLVDIRIGPCASDPRPAARYGPRLWHLQVRGEGVASLVERAGIAYEWMVELGNPQRHDPAMGVLLDQLRDPVREWPVHRGLRLLADRVRAPGEVVAILRACEVGELCHRAAVAEMLREAHFGGELNVREVKTGLPLGPRVPGGAVE